MLHPTRPRFLPYGVAVFAVLLALVLMQGLNPWFDMARNPFLLFFGAIMISAWYGGLNPGLLATLLSMALSSFFFIEPIHGFSFDASDVLRTGLFGLQGVLVSFLCESMRSAKQRAEVNLRKLRVSEERFRLALSSSDISVFQQDQALRYQWIHNPQGLGLTAEVINHADAELFAPSDRDRLTAIKASVLENGVAVRDEIRLTLNGETHYYDLIIEPLQFGRSSQGITGAAINITDRKQAEEALRYLVETSRVLSSSLDCALTLEQVAQMSVPYLADWCSIEILDEGGSLYRMPIAYTDPDKAEWAQKLQTASSTFNGTDLISNILRSGEPELFSEITDSMLVDAFQDEEQLQTVRALGMKSAMIVPLVVRQRILGVIAFVMAESDRRYTPADLQLALDLAHRAALAIDNSRLYQKMQQMVQQQAESLSLLDALLAAAPIAVCFLDRELRYVRINQVLADIHGVTIEDHLGQRFRDILPTMAEQFEPQLQHVLDTGEPMLNVEISGDTQGESKQYGYWLGNYYPVRSAADDIVGLGIILVDITATKHAKEALQESEERFRAMFNQAAVGIAQVGLDGHFIEINPALCDITGYRDDELSQMTFQQITHPDDLEMDWQFARRVLAKEISGYSLEKRYIRKDGSITWVNLTSSAVWDAAGQPKYAVGIIEDISDRKRAEAAQRFLLEISTLLASSLDYEATLAGVAHLAVPILGDWCIVDIVQDGWTLQQIAIACTRPELQQNISDMRHRYAPKSGKPHPIIDKLRQGHSVFYPQFDDSILPNMAQDEEHLQLLQRLKPRSLMVIPLVCRGQVFGSFSFAVFDSNRFYDHADLALAEDVARRAAVAIDNARLYQEAQRVNRIKDEFLAVLSHELRTPLNPILGWARLLQTRKYDETTTQRALEIIERNARLQAQLIEDLLDVSRILRGKLSLNIVQVDLANTIESALETVRLSAEAKSIDLEFTILSPEWENTTENNITSKEDNSELKIQNSKFLVSGDAGRLQQVMWNLLSNAVKFTPNGGRVEVSLSWGIHPVSFAKDNQQRTEDKYAQITVRDTGKGINPDFLPFVFDYFRQADGTTTRKFGGLGLGLAIVRHLVELHGGIVQAESSGENQGATFIVQLRL